MPVPSPRLAAYAALAAAGLIGGLASAEPAALAIGGAFAFFLVAGLIAPPPRAPACRCAVDRVRALEGDEARLTIELATPAPAWVTIELIVPDGLVLREGRRSLALRLRGGDVRRLDSVLGTERWGAFPLGEVQIVTRDRFGLRELRTCNEPPRRLRVYPRSEDLRRLVATSARLTATGVHASRLRGDGIEFAEVRRYVEGDPLRRINWRASARADRLFVNGTHAERAADVCVFLDAFAAAAHGEDDTFVRAVRLAVTLTRAALRGRDRVGLVSFGGTLRWAVPSTGVRQLHQIVETVIESEVERSFVWRGVDTVPRRVLPPGSLVLAVTPLLDERANRALVDLRGRGHDVIVLEIDPERSTASDDAGVDAVRLWRFWREALRSRLAGAGIAVARLEPGRSAPAALEEVARWRRRPRAPLA
jgi:uncharacterized protein (DUF58 family)